MIGFMDGFRAALQESEARRQAEVEADIESAYGPGSESPSLMDFGVTGHQPFGDFSANVPEGWVSVMPNPGNTKALMVIGMNPDFAGVILVDVTQSSQPTAQATAEELASEHGGEVAPDGVTLDGVDGVRVTTSSNDLDIPREIIVVHRNN